MAQNTGGLIIAGESATKLGLHKAVIMGANGLWGLAGLAVRPHGISVSEGNESAAPYSLGIQINGVAQVEITAAAIAVADFIACGAAGQVLSHAQADGIVVHHWLGIAISAAAANAGLLIDVLIQPWSASNI